MFLRRKKAEYAHLNPDKLALVDIAFHELGCRSFADFGGVWGVNGGYTFYTLEHHEPRRGYLVDHSISEEVGRRSEQFGNLVVLCKDFASPTLVNEIGEIDAVYFFDILLHQVKPDWNQILTGLRGLAKYFLIYNQQWVRGTGTVRLLDLGEEEYFRNIPHSREESLYSDIFSRFPEKLDENRTYRDCPAIWQWGITDEDLIDTMKSLEYTMVYYKDCGRFGDLPSFRDRAFIFAREI